RTGLSGAQDLVGTSDQSLAAIETELRQRRTVASTRQQLSLDLFSTEAERRGACERIRERQTSLRERRDAAAARRAELETRLGALSGTMAGARERHDGLALELDESRRMMQTTEQAIASLAELAQAADNALSTLR